MTDTAPDDPRRPENRLAYRAAVDRPRLALPGGKSVAVWPVVNVEHWLIDNPMPRQILVPPTAASLLPDLPNWAWHEYGMRVGFWRFFETFASRGISPTLSINGSVCTAIRGSRRRRGTPAGSSWPTASIRSRPTGSRTSPG